MLRFHHIPFALHLTNDTVKCYWSDNGSRWVFPDAEFMRKREIVGLDSHIIHFHSPFFIKLINGKEVIKDDPIMQFNDLQSLIHFRMIL